MEACTDPLHGLSISLHVFINIYLKKKRKDILFFIFLFFSFLYVKPPQHKKKGKILPSFPFRRRRP